MSVRSESINQFVCCQPNIGSVTVRYCVAYRNTWVFFLGALHVSRVR